MDEGSHSQCTNKIDTDKYKCARKHTHPLTPLSHVSHFLHTRTRNVTEINALKFVLSGLSVYFVLLLSALSRVINANAREKKKQKNKKKWMGKIYLTHNYTL